MMADPTTLTCVACSPLDNLTVNSPSEVSRMIPTTTQ